MTYKFATGYDNASGYADIVPQPACEGLVPGVIVEGLDGRSYEEGFTSTELVFNVVSALQAETLYTLFGLTTARSVLCTLSLPTNEGETSGIRTFDDFNAILHKPTIGRQGTYKYWWKNLVFKVSRIEVAA